MPESTGQVQDRDTRVPSRNIFENRERIVRAAVEYVNDSKGVTLRKTGHDSRERPVKNRQPFLLIIDG